MMSTWISNMPLIKPSTNSAQYSPMIPMHLASLRLLAAAAIALLDLSSSSQDHFPPRLLPSSLRQTQRPKHSPSQRRHPATTFSALLPASLGTPSLFLAWYFYCRGFFRCSPRVRPRLFLQSTLVRSPFPLGKA